DTEWPKSLTSAPARAASQRIAWRPCRPRAARAQRTTTDVVPADAGSALGFACPASVISALGPHLAAEDPIGPRRISENERHQHGDAEQHEDLTVLRRGRLPDGDALRHDVGIHADPKPGIGEHEQRQRQEERLAILSLGEA